MESDTKSSTQAEPAKTKSEARVRAKKIVDAWTVGSAATTWLPGAGLFSAAADQVMILQIARCFGVSSDDEAKSHLAALIGSGVGGVASEGAFFLLPVLGWAIKGVLLTAKARYIGEAAVRYFEGKSSLPEK